MKKLAELKCVPCRGNVPALTDMDISMLLPELPNWELFEFDGIKRLERISGRAYRASIQHGATPRTPGSRE